MNDQKALEDFLKKQKALSLLKLALKTTQGADLVARIFTKPNAIKVFCTKYPKRSDWLAAILKTDTFTLDQKLKMIDAEGAVGIIQAQDFMDILLQADTQRQISILSKGKRIAHLVFKNWSWGFPSEPRHDIAGKIMGIVRSADPGLRANLLSADLAVMVLAEENEDNARALFAMIKNCDPDQQARIWYADGVLSSILRFGYIGLDEINAARHSPDVKAARLELRGLLFDPDEAPTKAQPQNFPALHLVRYD